MMLTEEDKMVLHYLRQSPRDPLKKQAADLIEKLSNDVNNLDKAVQTHLQNEEYLRGRLRAADYFSRS